MSVLSSLKLVAAKRPNSIPVVQVRRNKLCAKLDDQINLAKALRSGESYAPTSMRTIQDPQTGETKRVAVPRRVRQWWFASDGGKICLQVKYGMKALLLGKDKTVIEVANADELLKALDLLKQATAQGELDAQLDSASDRLGKGFKKK